MLEVANKANSAQVGAVCRKLFGKQGSISRIRLARMRHDAPGCFSLLQDTSKGKGTERMWICGGGSASGQSSMPAYVHMHMQIGKAKSEKEKASGGKMVWKMEPPAFPSTVNPLNYANSRPGGRRARLRGMEACKTLVL